MLLSDGFSLTTDPSLELETDIRNEGDTTTSRDLDIARQLIKLANRSSVVIYAMDARGLQYTEVTAADNTTTFKGTAARNPVARGVNSSRQDLLARTRSGLKYIAEETGGFAVFNNNDIGSGISKVVEDQSYYLIAYQPSEETFDPQRRKFHKLEIKVRRPGLKVRYRSGFFGVSDADEEKAEKAKLKDSDIVAAIKAPFSLNDVNIDFKRIICNRWLQ